ncbi:hypothetical protein SeMB42_g07878 [Synchytrium endobioticum]|uniref:Uncharacterized protein n=1 Tax=Synchytrium endobioticum TaxID=286115 RepID=A0A507BLX9_9FUNG|nr:hypothetical protein SeMB42_g07878 [Synchytrium endobioticum]
MATDWPEGDGSGKLITAAHDVEWLLLTQDELCQSRPDPLFMMCFRGSTVTNFSNLAGECYKVMLYICLYISTYMCLCVIYVEMGTGVRGLDIKRACYFSCIVPLNIITHISV